MHLATEYALSFICNTSATLGCCHFWSPNESCHTSKWITFCANEWVTFWCESLPNVCRSRDSLHGMRYIYVEWHDSLHVMTSQPNIPRIFMWMTEITVWHTGCVYVNTYMYVYIYVSCDTVSRFTCICFTADIHMYMYIHMWAVK